MGSGGWMGGWVCASDSVGSTIRVPTAGQLIVGACKPKSISRLAMSFSLMPQLA